MQLVLLTGILALAGNAIQGEVYSWVAVVVLPINSSVNPVIYTLLTALQKKVLISINVPVSLAIHAGYNNNKNYNVFI